MPSDVLLRHVCNIYHRESKSTLNGQKTTQKTNTMKEIYVITNADGQIMVHQYFNTFAGAEKYLYSCAEAFSTHVQIRHFCDNCYMILDNNNKIICTRNILMLSNE